MVYENSTISAFFDSYRQRYFTWLTWEERLLGESKRDTWISVLCRRAESFNLIYSQNLRDFREVLIPICQHPEQLTDEQFDIIFDKTVDMYRNDWADPFLLKEIGDLLYPHYVMRNDTERKIFLDVCLGFACLEISRVGERSLGLSSVEHYRQVIALSDHLEQLSVQGQRYVMVSYANLISSEASVQNISIEESYNIWLQLKEITRRPTFAALGESTRDLAAAYIKRFAASGFSLSEDRPDTVPKWLQKTLGDMVLENHQQQEAAGERIIPDLELNYLRLMKRTGKLTSLQVWKRLVDYLNDRRANPDENDDIISLYIDFYSHIIEALMETDLPPDFKLRQLRMYRRDMEHFAATYPYTRDSYTLNCALEQFTFAGPAMKCCPNKQEKMRLLFRLVISRHINTFLHSLMVARFATRITRCAVSNLPGLFVGFHSLQSKQDVLNHSSELIRFAYEAAILHDVGKNGLIDIINTQYRRINDLEFSIIKTHPTKGAAYLDTDADFRIYRDVALGHHRFYDGSGGYPMDFDNCASPDKIMIDLITLCDCLDAGTDYLGRNYHQCKTVDDVLEEFKAGAGVRYHPDLTRLLCENQTLLKDLRQLASTSRESIYFDAYHQYFTKEDAAEE